jgi:uncharacterized protein YqeY
VVLSEARLAGDLAAAMKARDMRRVYVLRGVVTAAKNLKVERRGADLSEADLIQIVRKEIKKREEAEGFAQQAGRRDAVEENRAERSLLETYAPALLSEEQLVDVVRELVAGGAAELGAVMSALRDRHPGGYDGKIASAVARRVLAERAS